MINSFMRLTNMIQNYNGIASNGLLRTYVLLMLTKKHKKSLLLREFLYFSIGLTLEKCKFFLNKKWPQRSLRSKKVIFMFKNHLFLELPFLFKIDLITSFQNMKFNNKSHWRSQLWFFFFKFNFVKRFMFYF